MAEFGGEAAFVTGAGSGIGRAISLALASQGAFVWVTDYDQAGADATVELIEQAGGQGRAVKLDVTREEDWQSALELCEREGGKLRALVNCAGKSSIAETFSMPLNDFRSIMAINVEGTFLGMKHVIPRIAEAGGGSVINISSIAGLKGGARMAAYCGSKGAIRLMTKAVALECAEIGNGVRVNSVHPGVVDTPAWRKHGPEEVGIVSTSVSSGATVLDPHVVAKKMVPLGVAASSAEIAGVVAFLASDAARHMTGAEIVIDGGMTAG